jgi:ABC-type nitrate/sulfonate/bicarbonate transport system substrate-binding protein
MSTLRLALDWTPNSNHAGLYLALEKGWYKDAGIDLHILPPSSEYTHHETPARQVVQGTADLCVCPSESLISCWTSDLGKVKPICVATLLQNDTSAIAVPVSTGITSMAQLDGKKYASYGGRFEMKIIEQMIKDAGGEGTVIEVLPPKLECFDSVLNGDCQATWVFMGWEGIQVKDKVDLQYFPVTSSGVPYGYSPCLLASPSLCTDEKDEILKAFLAVTAKGYQLAASDPKAAAAALLKSGHPSLLSFGIKYLEDAQAFLSNGGHYLDDQGSWGTMSLKKWEHFIDWLSENHCLTYRDGSLVPRHALNVGDMVNTMYLQVAK